MVVEGSFDMVRWDHHYEAARVTTYMYGLAQEDGKPQELFDVSFGCVTSYAAFAVSFGMVILRSLPELRGAGDGGKLRTRPPVHTMKLTCPVPACWLACVACGTGH